MSPPRSVLLSRFITGYRHSLHLLYSRERNGQVHSPGAASIRRSHLRLGGRLSLVCSFLFSFFAAFFLLAARMPRDIPSYARREGKFSTVSAAVPDSCGQQDREIRTLEVPQGERVACIVRCDGPLH